MRVQTGDFPIHSQRELRSPILRAINTAATFAILAVAYLGVGGCESYCVLWPSIDTVYAPGFTDAGFERVQVGMTREDVRAQIGEPLDKDFRSVNRLRHPGYQARGDEVWTYTRDGGCPWSDWAWLSREVLFSNGRVVQRVYWTYYD